MYQDVLVPTDGSDGTREPLSHGLAVADRFDATVHALSVVPDGPFGADGEAAIETANRAVERVDTEAQQAGLETVTAVERGVPHEEILAYVADNDVDMIVMGTQGRTGLDRVLLGSVAERVLRLADVPVVTVRSTGDLRVEDATAAETIAREEASHEGYDDVDVRDEPHRTSASWIVPVEADGDSLHVHVDAVSGEARVAGSGGPD
ncbi:universal stress protein [Natrarchaeobaculum aegyptiacum]|uniref:Universal stress protein UspA n=1 Tax=Natrarchaeobaculum aegyptiacum TaxID=745377 RepID=A0A2Z2HXW4_9EURY|nr:universal stress protein [Natrarchaeobaculum aegyptiacum]ARS91125.1 universal stress protein UspA [Natrarchaeobaculum aegyptiacum]